MAALRQIFFKHTSLRTLAMSLERRQPQTIWAILCFCCSAALADVGETISIIDRWIETNHTIAQTRQAWLVEKEELASENTLLGNELEQLRSNLDLLSELNASLIEQQAEAATSSVELDATLTLLAERADRFEKKLSKLSRLFPTPLRESVEPKLQRAREEENLSVKFQTILAAIDAAHKFNLEPTLVQESRESENGTPKIMDTLYWGLAIAYSVDSSGTAAYIGYPSPNSWTWQPAMQHADKVREAIDVFKENLPPAYLSIPLQLSDG